MYHAFGFPLASVTCILTTSVRYSLLLLCCWILCLPSCNSATVTIITLYQTSSLHNRVPIMSHTEMDMYFSKRHLSEEDHFDKASLDNDIQDQRPSQQDGTQCATPGRSIHLDLGLDHGSQQKKHAPTPLAKEAASDPAEEAAGHSADYEPDPPTVQQDDICSSTTPQPLRSSSDGSHDEWTPRFGKVQKCDFCSERSEGVLYRCIQCTVHICQTCSVQGKWVGDKHSINHAVLDWTPRQKPRKSYTPLRQHRRPRSTSGQSFVRSIRVPESITSYGSVEDDYRRIHQMGPEEESFTQPISRKRKGKDLAIISPRPAPMRRHAVFDSERSVMSDNRHQAYLADHFQTINRDASRHSLHLNSSAFSNGILSSQDDIDHVPSLSFPFTSSTKQPARPEPASGQPSQSAIRTTASEALAVLDHIDGGTNEGVKGSSRDVRYRT
ncbi:hypothetical protein B0T17DRAFT_332361 [Bombardia bombarda]|uniref:Uncharacterized protein n=1 Tax=Bombardia bombarda TaxID=252184 RepID=A0AA40BYL3_9PEZI|nr:hypothetical protein B0T17DRAFT_332361 [Bombardia bombarda]